MDQIEWAGSRRGTVAGTSVETVEAWHSQQLLCQRKQEAISRCAPAQID